MLRRHVLKLIASFSLIGSGLLKPLMALAKWNEAAFSATNYDEAVATFFPEKNIKPSDKIIISVRSEIENGAVVPVKVNTSLNKPISIALFADRNPNPLIANFDLSEQSIGFISTRIKLQESSNIIVIVRTQDGVFFNKKFVTVHEGGCA